MPMYDRKSYKNPRLPRANEAMGAGQRSPSAPPRGGGMLKMAAAARARQPKPGAPPIPETRPFNPAQRPSGAPPQSAVQQTPAGIPAMGGGPGQPVQGEMQPAGMTEADRRRRAAAIIAQDKQTAWDNLNATAMGQMQQPTQGQDKQAAWDNLNAMAQGQGGQPTQYPTIPKPPDEKMQMLEAQGGPGIPPGPTPLGGPSAGEGVEPEPGGAPGQQAGLYEDVEEGAPAVPPTSEVEEVLEMPPEAPATAAPVYDEEKEPPPVYGTKEDPEPTYEAAPPKPEYKDLSAVKEKEEALPSGSELEEATWPDAEEEVTVEGTTPGLEAEEQAGKELAKQEGWTEFTDDQGNSWYQDEDGNYYDKYGNDADPDDLPGGVTEYGYGHGDTQTALAQHQKYEKAFSDYLSQSTGIPEEELKGQIAQLQMASADQMSKFAQQMASRGLGASGIAGAGMGQIASQTVAAVANLRFENAKLAIDEKLNKMKAYMSMYGQMMSEQNRKDIFDEMSALEKDKFKYEKDQNVLADEWTKLNNMAAMAQAYDDDAMSYAFNAMTELVHDTDGDGKPDAPMSAAEVMANLYTYTDKETGIVRLGLKDPDLQGGEVEHKGWKMNAPVGSDKATMVAKKWENAPQEVQEALEKAFYQKTGHNMVKPDGQLWTAKFGAWLKEEYGWTHGGAYYA